MSPTAPWRELRFSFVKLTLKVQETWKKSESGSGYLKCHILIIVDAQFDIKNNELESIKYWYTFVPGRMDPSSSPFSTLSLWIQWIQARTSSLWTYCAAPSVASLTTSCSFAWLADNCKNPFWRHQQPSLSLTTKSPQKTSKVAGASWSVSASVPGTSSISVWVLTQQITRITKPFQVNVAVIVLFYTLVILLGDL